MPPRRQWIDKKTAITYQLLHRPQNDPLIHDPNADDRVLHQVSGPAIPATSSPSPGGKATTSNLAELESEFDSTKIRKNEGEAANYGIFFDDSEYDYMQHLRDLGGGVGSSQFVEAIPVTVKGKGKGKGRKMKLEDALRETTLDDDSEEASHAEKDSPLSLTTSSSSSFLRKQTYQNQQDVPDDIAGLQPDMDPRLREALEALEDEAFVDQDGDDDIFGTLVEGGQAAQVEDLDEWKKTYVGEKEKHNYGAEDDDGWESDVTEKAPVQISRTEANGNVALPSYPADEVDSTQKSKQASKELPPPDELVPDMDPAHGDWLRHFAKYKTDMRAGPITNSELRTATSTMFTEGGTPIRKKKRKGARTNPSAYSMTSSSLARTDGHRLLDARFEKMEALYSLDEGGDEYEGSSLAGDDDVSIASSRVSRMSSQAPSLVSVDEKDNASLPADFDQVMDGFLDGWNERGNFAKRKGAKGKRGKNGNEAVGMKMLDEIRTGLGAAHVYGKV